MYENTKAFKNIGRFNYDSNITKMYKDTNRLTSINSNTNKNEHIYYETFKNKTSKNSHENLKDEYKHPKTARDEIYANKYSNPFNENMKTKIEENKKIKKSSKSKNNNY